MAISDWLRDRTKEWNALADAAERLATLPTIEVRLTGTDQAEQLRRQQAPQLTAELRKRLKGR